MVSLLHRATIITQRINGIVTMVVQLRFMLTFGQQYDSPFYLIVYVTAHLAQSDVS